MSTASLFIFIFVCKNSWRRALENNCKEMNHLLPVSSVRCLLISMNLTNNFNEDKQINCNMIQKEEGTSWNKQRNLPKESYEPKVFCFDRNWLRGKWLQKRFATSEVLTKRTVLQKQWTQVWSWYVWDYSLMQPNPVSVKSLFIQTHPRRYIV